MALPNKPLGELKAVRDPEVEEREVDVLIVGGGMAACGAAFEAKKWMSDDQSVLMVDKAALLVTNRSLSPSLSISTQFACLVLKLPSVKLNPMEEKTPLLFCIKMIDFPDSDVKVTSSQPSLLKS